MPAALSDVVKGLCDVYGAAHSVNQDGTFNVWVSDEWNLGSFHATQCSVTSSSLHGIGESLKVQCSELVMKRGTTICDLKRRVEQLWYV